MAKGKKRATEDEPYSMGAATVARGGVRLSPPDVGYGPIFDMDPPPLFDTPRFLRFEQEGAPMPIPTPAEKRAKPDWRVKAEAEWARKAAARSMRHTAAMAENLQAHLLRIAELLESEALEENRLAQLHIRTLRKAEVEPLHGAMSAAVDDMSNFLGSLSQ